MSRSSKKKPFIAPELIKRVDRTYYFLGDLIEEIVDFSVCVNTLEGLCDRGF